MLKRVSSVVLALALLPACTPHQAFVNAERAVYDAVAPEYKAYFESDVKLSPEQVLIRQQMLDAWLLSLEAAGGVKP